MLVAPRRAVRFSDGSKLTIRRDAVRCIALHRKGHLTTAGGSGTVLRMAEIGYEWQRVADDITARIDSGELPPGSMLRGERSLAEEYGVSVDTIRRATKHLRETGRVVTLAHKGTFVRNAEG